jgi:hypothetical protein
MLKIRFLAAHILFTYYVLNFHLVHLEWRPKDFGPAARDFGTRDAAFASVLAGNQHLFFH